MTEREKIINIMQSVRYCKPDSGCGGCKYDAELDNYSYVSCHTLRIADALIEAGIGDVKETEHRAEVTGRAFSKLVHEMYEHGIRPMCDEKFFVESRLKDAEKEIAEEKDE